MSGQWKPGDVVLLQVGTPAERIGIRDVSNEGWRTSGGYMSDGTTPTNSVHRPLLVIDPEDREQVVALLQAYGRQYTSWSPDADGPNVDRLQAALRSLAQPEDPEPTGLGAVVRDGEGRHWVKYETSSPTFRWRRGGKLACGWNDLARPLTVLSTGWTEDER